jgi:hypothetical protein
VEYQSKEPSLKFEKDMADVGDMPAPDVKVSPDYFINTALFRSQKVLETEDIKNASAKYRIFIELIEVIAKATDLVPDDYESSIEKFKGEKEYTELTNEYQRHIRISNYKLLLLMREIWGRKPKTGSLKM